MAWTITDSVEFDKANRAYCPSCLELGRTRKKNLSLLESGAYKCHAGCSTEDIRAALKRPTPHQPGKATQQTQTAQDAPTTAERVYQQSQQLLRTAKAQPARDWLRSRGIALEVIEHYKLGLSPCKVGRGDDAIDHLSIAIPIPNNSGSKYWQKKRVAPWDEAIQLHPDYQGWKQYGVPQLVYFTHNPPRAQRTWLCEGEWDAIRLGWAVMHSDFAESIAVSTFTCGASNIPATDQLDRLPGDVVIFYDRNDKPLPNGTLPGDAGAQKLAARLGSRGKVGLVPMPEGCTVQGWDVSNALDQGYTVNDFDMAANAAKAIELQSAQPEADSAGIELEAEPCRRLKNIQMLQQHWGNRIRLNELTGNIELDGEATDVDEIPLLIAEEFNKVISKDEAAMIVTRMARRNPYHPIQEYLERVEQEHPDETGAFALNIASRYFETTNPLYDTFVRLTLVGAVRRIFEPGCKHDYSLILYGNQGYRKSSFFRMLAGQEWFDDSLGNASDKDERLKLHRTWLTEWAELETIFGRKDQAAVKAFLTSQVDYVRPPYGREVKAMPRRSIIVGSTNRDDFLSDPTGARRFWVVPVNRVIDTTQLQIERDRIWAAAVKLYRTGLHVTLSPEEELQARDLVKLYEPEDPWFSYLEPYCQREGSRVSIPAFMNDVLRIEPGRQNRAEHGRIADMLRRLGYSRKREWQDGRWVRVWVKNEPATDTRSTNDPLENHSSVRGSNGFSERDSGINDPLRTLENAETFPNSHATRNSIDSQVAEQNLSFFPISSGSSGSLELERQAGNGFQPRTLETISSGSLVDQVDHSPHPPDKPLPAEELDLLVELLKAAQTKAHTEDFSALAPQHKAQIWEHLTAAEKQRIRELISTPN